jgi:hypothetical protein
MIVEKKDVSVLVVGKSGAGKSEFIGSFSSNNKLINSSGGGQTTRTSVEYNFHIKDITPVVQIHFLTEEQFIEKRLEQIGEINIPSGKYDLSVKEQVLEIEGFFNYKEFDFDNKDVSSQIDVLWNEFLPENFEKDEYTQDEFEVFKDKLKNRLDEITNERNVNSKLLVEEELNKSVKPSYKLIDVVELILQAVYKICRESIKDYPTKFELEHINEENKKKLTYCLKVDENNKSVTGLISKVVIDDNICLNYEKILAKLGIKTLTFIDTYGLDHDKTATPEVVQHRYSVLFNEFPRIETVLFIRALGSDAPTDLESAIPMIYASNPAAVPYIVFTKIDLNEMIQKLPDVRKIDLISLNESKQINAVNYFIKTRNAKEIKKKLNEAKIPEILIESRYEVLLNNLIPYCSKDNELYLENNKNYVIQLFKSILNKEHLGKSFVNINSLISLKDRGESRVALVGLLKDMFKHSSINWGNYTLQRRTIGANRKRFEQDELGYDGTYLHSWRSRFNSGYNEVFSKISAANFESFFTINPNTNESTAIQEILNGFSKYFLRFSNWIEHNGIRQGDNFKKIIVEQNPEYKKYNKFICDMSPIYTWLTSVYDFNSYFDDIQDDVYAIIMDKFLDNFISDCREHNARVLAKSVDQSLNSDMIFKEYFTNYDSNLQDKTNFQIRVNSYLDI